MCVEGVVPEQWTRAGAGVRGCVRLRRSQWPRSAEVRVRAQLGRASRGQPRCLRPGLVSVTPSTPAKAAETSGAFCPGPPQHGVWWAALTLTDQGKACTHEMWEEK